MKRTICFLLLISLFFNLKILTLFADTLSTGETVSVSAIVAGNPTPPGSGGGSLSGSVSMPQTSVRFSGEAYPNATVTLLKNGKYGAGVIAGKSGLFDITLEEKYDGTMLYSLQAQDITGQKSLLINYPLVVTAGYLTYISGIRFPPTITLDKLESELGDYLTVAGYALPDKELQIVIANQDNEQASKTFTLTSPLSGRYDITLPLIGLPLGNYSVYVKYTNDTRISKLVRLIIGDTNISSIDTSLNIPGDCNADGRIDLVDFSIMAFWYKKPNPPSCVDINKDGIVDLTDFSILAFYWTD